MTTHFAPVATKLGEFGTSYLPYSGGGFCAADDRARLDACFSDPAHQRPGSARNLAQVLEGIDECIRLRARATPAVTAFLGSRGGP